jgi:hypothetical protein
MPMMRSKAGTAASWINWPEGMQARQKELDDWKFQGVPPSSVKREFLIPDAA